MRPFLSQGAGIFEHMFDTASDASNHKSAHVFDGGLLEDEMSAWEWTELDDDAIYALTKKFYEDPATWAPPTTEELVHALRVRASFVAEAQAQLFEVMAAIFDEYEKLSDGDVMEAASAAAVEIRAALVSTRRTAESDLELAWRLRDRLPRVLEAMRSGVIDLRRARVIVDGTVHLDPGRASVVVDEVLPLAPRMTTGQLRALIRRLCIDIDPDDARSRYRSAVDERRVSAELTEDGTATLIGSDLPPDRVAAIMDRLTGIAQTLTGGDEVRTIDQLRADVFLDLLEGGDSYGRRGTIDIRVDLATLVNLEDRSAELGGFGPVVADIARQTAERFGPQWRYTLTDHAGDPVHTGTTRRRPNATLRRQVEARDATCVFPGCRTPARSCDLDHRIPVAEGGETHVDQLVALCRHHHVIRHRFDWRHTRRSDGTHVWKSPLGVVYERPPPA